MNLFEYSGRKESLSSSPLSSRMRPKTLDEFIGQEHILGKGKALYNLVENKSIPSMIFWGPPGTGKTTLAKIIAKQSDMNFRALSAVSSGLSDIRKISDEVIFQRTTSLKKTILFLDEIHRFSKSQQDSLLPLIEEGILILIGATTEHPGFSIINPLISRVKIFKFNPHDEMSINNILNKIIKNKEELLKYSDIIIEEDVLKILSKGCGGDARKAIDTLELAVLSSKTINNKKLISKNTIKELLKNNII